MDRSALRGQIHEKNTRNMSVTRGIALFCFSRRGLKPGDLISHLSRQVMNGETAAAFVCVLHHLFLVYSQRESLLRLAEIASGKQIPYFAGYDFSPHDVWFLTGREHRSINSPVPWPMRGVIED